MCDGWQERAVYLVMSYALSNFEPILKNARARVTLKFEKCFSDGDFSRIENRYYTSATGGEGGNAGQPIHFARQTGEEKGSV